MSADRRFDGWLRRIQGLLWFIVAPYYPATRRCHPPPTNSRAQSNALGKASEAGRVKALLPTLGLLRFLLVARSEEIDANLIGSTVDRHHVGGKSPLKYGTMCLAIFHLNQSSKLKTENEWETRRVCGGFHLRNILAVHFGVGPAIN